MKDKISYFILHTFLNLQPKLYYCRIEGAEKILLDTGMRRLGLLTAIGGLSAEELLLTSEIMSALPFVEVTESLDFDDNLVSRSGDDFGDIELLLSIVSSFNSLGV
ncbi:hypothetical protein [Calothrix sp. PCC 7507]|uniref:hypothetical protein n=1 Tax=Calothrix sp. PCC 7507 TaxID=99598 RepID=UPI00029ECE86|nr:hypothetical protein [Calothrix sp. PCC 7507]AFY33043.1 hypothetical protein Cal7507_2622 [Calothrix sp. PCC 7507]